MSKHFLRLAVTIFAAVALISVERGGAARAQDGKTTQPAPNVELPPADAEGFINLFNGKDLTYWEGYPGYWSVKDGAITGSETSANSKHTFLVLSASKAKPAKFGNFELHFSYRWAEKGKGGNSGVQFRSKIIDEKSYKVGGYQADLDVNGQYDGGYYDEAGVAGKRGIFAPRGFKTTWDPDNKKKQEPLPSGKSGKELKAIVKPVGEWNTYVLVANRNHMSSKVNGELMAELIDDSPKALKDGVIALQIHTGATMTIQFKDMKIKLLAPTPDKQSKAPTNNWKMTDFVKDEKVGVEGLVNRNFERGKKLFTETKCLTCHTFAGAGGFVGPSLSAKGASFGPVDILVSILEPNKIIADAYRQKVVELDNGRFVTGMISENDDEIEITPDLLQPEKKVVVKAEKVVNMSDSPVSPMPAGLIDNLGRDQILDLIAYVISQDDPEDEMFALLEKRNSNQPLLPENSFMGVSLSRATTLAAATFALVAMIVLPAQAQDDPSRIFNFPPNTKKIKKGGAGGTTTPENITVADGFKVERIYIVPQGTQGSWVSMTVDPQGRLVAGGRDNAGIFRITPPALDGKPEDTKVEKLDLDLTSPNGLLYAFDSLYVMKCGGGGGGKGGGNNRPNGLYRITASKPGGEYDTVTLLRSLQGGGDHGPHYVQLSPDGKSLTVVCGNSTKVTEFANSYLPRIWGEDALHPLLASFGGVMAPSGWIAKVDPDGKQWDLYSAGFRNEYGAVYNHNGDLFTYDSDMEWDIGLPWYRPSRVSMAASGGDAGFRNGSRNMPPRYPDTLPPMVDIGLGSPVGVAFGYGAKFPAKYQEALYINDWSYGRIFAVHLKPQGSSYQATAQPFLSGPGMSLTDVVINPKDGAMYFCIGGNSQSALYRVTYVGNEPTAPAKNDESFAAERTIRHKLEAFHGKQDPRAVEVAWPYLGSDDRFIRFAARVAIEHQDVKQWQDRALKETNPVAAIHGLLALVRAVGKDHTKGGFGGGKKGFGGFPGGKGGDNADAKGDAGVAKSTAILGVEWKGPILDALERIDVAKLKDSQKCDILRVYSVLLNRLGKPDDAQRERIIKRFDPLFPVAAEDYNIGLNADLCQLLCHLEAPGIQAKALKAIEMAQKRPLPASRAWTAMPNYQGPVTHSQVEELTYAWHLAYVKTGWEEPQKKQIADLWTTRFSTFRGGNLYNGSVNSIRQSTIQNIGQVGGEGKAAAKE